MANATESLTYKVRIFSWSIKRFCLICVLFTYLYIHLFIYKCVYLSYWLINSIVCLFDEIKNAEWTSSKSGLFIIFCQGYIRKYSLKRSTCLNFVPKAIQDTIWKFALRHLETSPNPQQFSGKSVSPLKILFDEITLQLPSLLSNFADMTADICPGNFVFI